MTSAKSQMRRRMGDITKAMFLTGFGEPLNQSELDLIYELMVQAGLYAEPASKHQELLLKIMNSPEFQERITRERSYEENQRNQDSENS
jgi:hypothetical protein